MSLRAYAKRRGVSATAVSLAIKAGRLVACVVRDANGQPKIGDPFMADREWAANTDLSGAPTYVRERSERTAPPVTFEVPEDSTAHEGMSMSEANAVHAVWKAKTAEMVFREKAGELVDLREISDQFATRISAARTKLLGIPSRAKQQIPTLSLADIALLEDLVREALEDVAQ